jgi:two-component system LytT family response regulator
MPVLRALIVDDEPPARRELRRLLAAHADVVIVGEAWCLADARAALTGDPPDVLFLDLRLGHDSGFEVLPAVPGRTAVVVVTAYDEYAVRAFETNALDYLLKPVEPERLAMTLARVRARGLAHGDGPAPVRSYLPDRLSANDWLLLRDGPSEEFVRTSTVACIIADGDYTRVCTIDGHTRLVHRTLREWEERLPAELFVRVHRSTLANLRHVLKVERSANYTGRVVVRGQPPIAVSRRAAARLRKLHG